MSSKPRILFSSHAATRNGATILLLHLLRWMKGRTDFEFEVLVNGRGELLGEFQDICPTLVWRDPEHLLGSLSRRWQAKVLPTLQTQMLKAVLRGRRYDVVHVNTASNWRHVPLLAQCSRGLIWHIHELSYALRTSMVNEEWRQRFPLAKRFVAASQSVKEALVTEFEVPAEKVDLVHEFIPAVKYSPEEKKLKRERIRSELGLSGDIFLVGGCGTLGWRKGTDLFLKIAQAMTQRGGEKCAFLWVGGGSKGDEVLQFKHELCALGLSARCKWVPNTANVSDYYHAMDVFALTSREDPFPLVMLEAGAAGLPTVCFANSGGGPEYAGQKAGLIAPYLDTEGFAELLGQLRDNPELRRRLGAEAAHLVETSYTVEKQAPLLLKTIEQCLQTS